MIKATLSLFLFGSVIIIQFCTACKCKKVSCPPYQDATFDSWINNFRDRVIFADSGTAKDTFTIQPIQRSSDHDANKGCDGSDDNGCSAFLRLFSGEKLNNGRTKLFITYTSLTGWDNNTSKLISISVKDLQVAAYNVSDTGFIFLKPTIQTAFIPSLTLRGRTFSNVQQIQIDTTAKTMNVYKIYFSRDSGLVAYEEYPSFDLWIRQ